MLDEPIRRRVETDAPLTEALVRDAADTLVRAFRATDTDAYFACFSNQATFVFHTEERRLDSRSEYEDLWRGWIQEGWRVSDCASSNAKVQLLGRTAVFTHDVRTTTETGGVAETTEERETIVFHYDDGGITAVHEHLGPVPMTARPDEHVSGHTMNHPQMTTEKSAS